MPKSADDAPPAPKVEEVPKEAPKAPKPVAEATPALKVEEAPEEAPEEVPKEEEAGPAPEPSVEPAVEETTAVKAAATAAAAAASITDSEVFSDLRNTGAGLLDVARAVKRGWESPASPTAPSPNNAEAASPPVKSGSESGSSSKAEVDAYLADVRAEVDAIAFAKAMKVATAVPSDAVPTDAVAETPTKSAEAEEVQEVQVENEDDLEVLDDAALMALSVDELKAMVEAGRGARRPKKRS